MDRVVLSGLLIGGQVVLQACIDVPRLAFDDRGRLTENDARADGPSGTADQGAEDRPSLPTDGPPVVVMDAVVDVWLGDAPVVADGRVVSDLNAADAVAPDALATDGPLPDGPPPDGPPPDGPLPDGPLPDGPPPFPPSAPERILVEGGEGVSALGSTVLALPDQNGDGFADAAIAAPGQFGRVGGRVRIVSGFDGTILATLGREVGVDGDFGRAMVLADLNSDLRPELYVSTPAASIGRGRVQGFTLPELGDLGRVTGTAINGHLGTALAAGRQHGLPVVFALKYVDRGDPTIVPLLLEGLAPGFDLDAGGPEIELRQLNIPGLVRNLATTRALDGGGDDDCIVSWGVGPSPEAVVRGASDGADRGVVANYEPAPEPPIGFGQSLLVAPAPSRLAEPTLYVGHPGAAGGGQVLGFALDRIGPQNRTFSFSSVEPSIAFGTSLAVAPNFWRRPNGVAAICVGDTGDPLHAGRVECVGPDLEDRFVVRSDALDDDFGRSISVSATRDVDGSWLLVVGAPLTLVGAARSGAVHLLHLRFDP